MIRPDNSWHGLTLLRWQSAEILPDLFQKDEGQNGVRPEPDKSWHVALEESQGTLGCRVSNQVQRSFEFSRFCVHGPSLQHVQRLGHGRCDCTLEFKLKIIRM